MYGHVGRQFGLEGMHVLLELFDVSPVDAVERYAVVGQLPGGNPIPIWLDFRI